MGRSNQSQWRRKYPRIARYPGLCPLCNEDFVPGDQIAWKPHRRPEHWDCYIGKQDAHRGPNPGRVTRDTWFTGSGRRTLSERALSDQQAVQRAQERHSQERASRAQ